MDGQWNTDTIGYTPDDLGRISQVSPQGGTAVSYVYDNLNLLTQIQLGSDSGDLAEEFLISNNV